MATILKAGNVASGAQITSDSTGILEIKTGTGSGTTALTVDTSQNVGIGTSSPADSGAFSRVLDIQGTVGAQVILRDSDDTSKYVRYAFEGGSVNAAQLSTVGTGTYLILGTGNTERMRINANAPILCLSGGNTSATGTGIAFPATQSTSSDANTLDDYEEGTFTPVIRGSGTAGTYQATNSGQYTKVGNIVTVNVVIQLGTITGGGTGYLQMTGFPFTNSGSSTGAVQSQGLDMTTNYTWLTAMPISDGTTTWYLAESGDNQAPSDFPISGVSSADVFRFTATYRAA
jgi:hypothetical protein